MFQKAVVLAVASLMMSSCMLEVDGEEEYGESEEASSRYDLRYQYWKGYGERLFPKETLAPVAILVGFGDDTLVMFGLDGARGQALFAYIGNSAQFEEMQNAAVREASTQTLGGAHIGQPPVLGGPPPIGPGGGEVVPANVIKPITTFSIDLHNAEAAFVEAFAGGKP